MVSHVLFLVGLVSASIVFAKLEIQIEGGSGWAGNLPTWRIQNRWTKLLYSSRPLTGYHFWMQLLILVLMHVPFLIGVAPFRFASELRVLAFLLLFWVVEDFLWFVLNPAFGLRRFRKEHVWWHAPTWWWFMPRDYWLYIPVATAMYGISCVLR